MTLPARTRHGYLAYVEYGTGRPPRRFLRPRLDAAMQRALNEYPWLEYDAWEARERTFLESAAIARDRLERYPPSPPDTE